MLGGEESLSVRLEQRIDPVDCLIVRDNLPQYLQSHMVNEWGEAHGLPRTEVRAAYGHAPK